MAEYSFGRNILQYIQNQDELNLRAKQLTSEEERYKAQQSYQNRQAQLVGTRWQADYDSKVNKEIYDRENDFSKTHVPLVSLPEDVKKQIPPEVVTNGFVPNEVITNLEEGNKRVLDVEKEKSDELYRVETLKNANDSERISQQNATTSRLSQQETARHNLVMESKETGSNNVISPKLYTENYSKGIANLTSLKNIMQNDDYMDKSKGVSRDYEKYKKEGTQAALDALGNVGITSATLYGDTGKTVLDYVRNGADLTQAQKNKYLEDLADVKKGSGEEALLRRKFFDDSLGSIKNNLLSEQYEALKLYMEIGTR